MKAGHLLYEFPRVCAMLKGNFQKGCQEVRHSPVCVMLVCVCVLCTAEWRGGKITGIIQALLSLCGSLHFHFLMKKKRRKDTASKLQSESRWPRFSAQGQKPLRMVDMESHDAQSAGKSRIYIRPPVS